MKLLRLVSLATVVLVFTGTASAIKWVDRQPDSGYGPLQYLNEYGTTVFEGDFDITKDGFKPGVHWIEDIFVRFWFADDHWGNETYEYVDIYVGGVKLWDNYEFDGNHSSPPSSYDDVKKKVTDYKVIYDDLADDGIVSYKVEIQSEKPSHKGAEDGWLKIVKLKAKGHMKQVPDSGSTLAIMGLGLIGLFLARRKLR